MPSLQARPFRTTESTMAGSPAQRSERSLERNARAVQLKPSVGQGTAVTKIRLHPGLRCDVEEGAWKFTVGMSEKYGGTNAGPNPGVYGRAAVGSCLAVGYGLWAARLGVQIDALDVEIQADYDARGELGVSDDVRPGYLAMRYIVTVESPAPAEDSCGSSIRPIATARGVMTSRTASPSVERCASPCAKPWRWTPGSNAGSSRYG